MPAPLVTRRAMLAAAAAALPAFAHAAAGDGWADIALQDAQQRIVRVGALGAPATLLKLWAHWCPVCLRELPALPGLAASLRADEVELILVSHPADWAQDQALATAHAAGVRLARVWAPGAAAAVPGVLLSADGAFCVPRSVLFSRVRQAVVWSHTGGADWAAPAALAPIRRAMPRSAQGGHPPGMSSDA